MGSSSQEERALNALGGPAAKPLGQFGWAMFDWANQPYYTIIVTILFAPYFVQEFIGDAVRGQQIYSLALTIAGVFTAIMSPVLGAIADVSGRRKPWMLLFSLGFVISVATLWFAEPGAPNGIAGPFLAIILAAISMEIAIVFNNAMLPSVAPANRVGWLSGFGWGIGYFGGLVALLFIQWFFVFPGQVALPGVPGVPLLGLDQSAFEPERFTAPFAAVWYTLFILPLFLFTPDGDSTKVKLNVAVRDGLSSLKKTLMQIRAYGNVIRFFIGRMIYADALGAVFAFSGIYAAAIFGWGSLELGISGLIILVFAGFGSMVGGWLDDKIGSKRTIVIAVTCLIVAAIGTVSIRDDRILFLITTIPASSLDGLFAGVSEQVYILFGCLTGLGLGPTQSASRTMVARLAPRHMVGEFYGLFAFSGQATAFLAPALIGYLTGALNDPRASIIVIIAMLVIGLVIILPVREERAEIPDTRP